MADHRIGGFVSEVTGDGPPVVMVHGLGGSSNSFQPIVGNLSNYKVVRIDLPGAGRSRVRPGLTDLMGLSTAVRDVMRSLGIPRAHMVGHSMGTLICQHLAVAEPNMVGSLTLFGPILEPPRAARAALRERADAARRDGMVAIADAVSTGSLSPETRERNPLAVAFVRESLMRQDPAGYALHCEALAACEPADHASIKAPSVLIAGRQDPVAPVDMVDRLGDVITGSRIEILPACGHWMMIEWPAIAGRLLGTYINRFSL